MTTLTTSDGAVPAGVNGQVQGQGGNYGSAECTSCGRRFPSVLTAGRCPGCGTHMPSDFERVAAGTIGYRWYQALRSSQFVLIVIGVGFVVAVTAVLLLSGIHS